MGECATKNGNHLCYVAMLKRGVAGVVAAGSGTQTDVDSYMSNFAYAPQMGCYKASRTIKLDDVDIDTKADGALTCSTVEAKGEGNVEGLESSTPALTNGKVKIKVVANSVLIYTCR